MAKPLTKSVTRNRLNNLHQLAKNVVSIDKDYEYAVYAKANSDAEFAVALYKFALEFYGYEAAIDNALAARNLKSKLTTSYFYKVSRLAFFPTHNDIEETEVDENRPQISKYAALIEGAHTQEYDLKKFKAKIDESMMDAIEYFRRSIGKPSSQTQLSTDDLVNLGKSLLANNFPPKTIDCPSSYKLEQSAA
jgi:hypothetical protein